MGKPRRPSAPGGSTAPRRPAEPPPTPTPRPADSRRWLASRAVVLAVVLGLVWLLLLRTRGPGEIDAEALRTASAAGCGQVEHPLAEAPGGQHLAAGGSYAYADRPAASGYHDPSPLPPEPHVYGEPVAETRAVHNLEHAYVLVYYRPAADGGLAPETVTALEGYAGDQGRVIMAPYPDLPEGISLALLAWNTRWECPAPLTPQQAVTIATGFVDAYRGTTVAPEAPRGLLGPFLTK